MTKFDKFAKQWKLSVKKRFYLVVIQISKCRSSWYFYLQLSRYVSKYVLYKLYVLTLTYTLYVLNFTEVKFMNHGRQFFNATSTLTFLFNILAYVFQIS